MIRFTFERSIPVQPPYRLDLTVDALRRLAANVVDVVGDDGVYRRALADERGRNLIEVTQPSARSLNVRIAGARAERWIPTIEAMLGTRVRLNEWYRRTEAFPWLDYLTRELRGLRPPRYPILWEALAHSIVFQQISIHAAASIMRRFVELGSEPIEYNRIAHYPFVTAEATLRMSGDALRSAGLSTNKIAHLRSAALSLVEGEIVPDEIEKLASPEAAQRLCSIRGIGPWSAAVVLLRGLGRLDVFPMKDSGVARSIRLLSGSATTDAGRVLEALGPVRGMLYFHLLLGRTRNLTATPPDSELT